MTAPSFTPALLDHYTELMSAVLYLGRTPASAPEIEQLADILAQLLERSRTGAKKNGIDQDRWREGLYPVVAWIDEQLLNMEWPGKLAWPGRSLQRQLFQTTLAGHDFFARLNKIPDADIPLREVYDVCLALGFRGQYFHPDDSDRLGEIMSKNLHTMHRELPLQLPRPLFPNGASKVVVKGVQGYRPDNPPLQILLWLLPILLLLGLYLVLRGSLPYSG